MIPLRLHDLAARDVLTVDADLPLGEALAQLATAGVSTLVVQVAGQAAGILTEHDWLRLLREQSPLNCPVGELMSTPLVAVSPEMEVDAAESLMQTRGIRHLALIDEDGRLQGVVSAATTWLAQRQSLRQSEDRLRQLFEHAPIPLVRINAGRPVLLNRAFSQLFGYVQSDFPDLRSWAHSAFPDPGVRAAVNAEWRAAVDKARASGQNTIAPLECFVCCANGLVRTVEVTGVLLGDEILVTFIDITRSGNSSGVWNSTTKVCPTFLPMCRCLPCWRICARVSRHGFPRCAVASCPTTVPRIRCSTRQSAACRKAIARQSMACRSGHNPVLVAPLPIADSRCS